MPAKNHNLHGNTPDKSEVALVLIDVINDLDFPEVDQFLHFAMTMARHVKELKQRAAAASVPAIYVNETLGAGDRISNTSWTIAYDPKVEGENW